VGVVRSRDSHEISLGASELLARTGVGEEEPEKLADVSLCRPESPTGSAPGNGWLGRRLASMSTNRQVFGRRPILCRARGSAMRANEGLAWMWLPANRHPMPLDVAEPDEARPRLGALLWTGRR
jgi:hypothetical protein